MTITRALAALARYVVKREPVLTGGALAGVVLGVLAWLGIFPGAEQHQWVLAVCNLAAPILTALVARMAAWSPAGHSTAVVAAQADVAATYTVAQGFPAAMVSQQAIPPAPVLNGRLDDPPTADPAPASTPASPKPAKKAPAKKAAAKKPAAKKKPAS